MNTRLGVARAKAESSAKKRFIKRFIVNKRFMQISRWDFFSPAEEKRDVSAIDIIICTSCTRSGLFSFLRAIIRSWSAILPSPWSYSFSSSSFFSAAL